MNDIIWITLSLAMFFFYQVKILKYASKILVGGTQKTWTFCFVALINTLLFIGYNAVMMPVSSFYFLTILVLGFEFKLVSKANFLQSFCGASVFLTHIAAIHIPTLMIFSYVKGIPSEELTINDGNSATAVLIATFLLAVVMLPFIEKVIDVQSIRRVTTAGKYTKLILVSTLVSVLYESIQVGLLVSEEIYWAQIIIAVSSSMYLLGAFYVLLMYGISLVNATLYKRKSDEAASVKVSIEETKKILYDKITKDALTNVYNRRYVMNLLDELCVTEDYYFGVLFVDVNGLKYMNDTHGHELGDRLICKIAEAITESVRDVDVVARIGGDEFIVVIDDGTNEKMNIVTERMRRNIRMQNQGEEIHISASIGMVLADDSIKKMGREHILSLADDAMRESKELFYKDQEEGAK